MDQQQKQKIAVCTRYSPLGASSRLRFYAYKELLEKQGIGTEFFPLLGNGYLKKLYAGKKSPLSGAFSLAKRFFSLPLMPSEMLIEYELMPFVPYEVEARLLSGRRYILAFDDAVWEKYRNTALEGKFEKLAANASGVIAANNSLASYLGAFNSNIIKIPTAIDLDRYRLNNEKYPEFTVCWIGTPVTYRECLLPFAETLRKASAELDFQLLVIARKDLEPIPQVNMKFLDWSSDTECEILSRCHAGVMPLPDTAFMRGKSAYKLIQYLGAGLPSVASPVGENAVLLSRKEVGFAANSAEDWINALKKLKGDSETYRRLSRNARLLAEEYSTQKYAPELADFIRKCLF